MTQIEFIYNLDSYEDGLFLILDKQYKNQKTMIFCDNEKNMFTSLFVKKKKTFIKVHAFDGN